MMKKFYLALVFILFFLFFYNKRQTDVVFLKKNGNSQNKTEYKSIKSLASYNLSIHLIQRFPITLSGNLFYDDKKFRLSASSFFGKELDIGINDNFLWYWSKRSKPKAIYYSDVKNLNRTGLKSALNPEWIIISLNINNNIENSKEIIKLPQGNLYLKDHNNALANGMTVGTLIDNDTVKGNYLFSNNGKMIASSEIIENQTIAGVLLPKKLHIIWYDENIIMDWHISDVQLNQNIHNNVWVMPNIYPKIDIGK